MNSFTSVPGCSACSNFSLSAVAISGGPRHVRRQFPQDNGDKPFCWFLRIDRVPVSDAQQPGCSATAAENGSENNEQQPWRERFFFRQVRRVQHLDYRNFLCLLDLGQ